MSSNGQRVHTPLPESRERATETGLDARKVGTAEERREDAATLAPRSGKTSRFAASEIPGSPNSREARTEPAAASDDDEMVLEPTKSVGYYSLRAPQLGGIDIPRAPRVPQLDLDSIGMPPVAQPSRSVRQSRPAYSNPGYSSPAETTRTAPTAEFESRHQTVRTPPPDAHDPRRRRSSPPPPPMQESRTLASPPLDSRSDRRSSIPAPPRIYFAPHVRSQANQWADTGSLSLPGCSSARHARALQRALLLALLHEPGWYDLPQGLQQRAGWLFCEGWESNSDGHAFREIDDLATVLGLPAGTESRRLLALAIAGVVPDHFSNRPPPSSFPPSIR